MDLQKMLVKMEGLEYISNILIGKKNKSHSQLDLFLQIIKQIQRLSAMQQKQNCQLPAKKVKICVT